MHKYTPNGTKYVSTSKTKILLITNWSLIPLCGVIIFNSKILPILIFVSAEECTADRCSRVPCQHGGKCLTSEDSAICLCPLGFSGDLCEIRVDLQVPSFNGSSHLRYRGLNEDALTWLDLELILKPTSPDGLVLYNGHRTDGMGDFMALYLLDGRVVFSFDLGTGAAFARSETRISVGEWHRIRVSVDKKAIKFIYCIKKNH